MYYFQAKKKRAQKKFKLKSKKNKNLIERNKEQLAQHQDHGKPNKLQRNKLTDSPKKKKQIQITKPKNRATPPLIGDRSSCNPEHIVSPHRR